MSNLSMLFTPAQCLGYVALALGVTAFLQKDDRRLKFLNATQSLFYLAHFALLGKYSASMSSLVSSTRSYLSLKTRSPWVALVMLVLGVALGAHYARDAYGYLPILSTAFGTIAIFFLHGVRMRLLLLFCTAMWLVNNLHSGSIGGSLLEFFVATANSFTMARLLLAHRRQRRALESRPQPPAMALAKDARS